MQSDIDQALRPELGPGEKLLWSGQPSQGLRLRPADALMIPFSVMWGGFAIYWELSVLRSGAPGFLVLWGIPFVLVGLYMIVGRFFVDARQRARTFYGVTTERALIVSGLFTRTVTSLPLRSLAEVTLDERGDRSGSITFGSMPAMSGWLAGSGWPGAGRQLPPRFDLIHEARQVYDRPSGCAAQRALQPAAPT